MKRIFLLSLFSISLLITTAQDDTRSREMSTPPAKSLVSKTEKSRGGTTGKSSGGDFITEKILPVTPVKNQQQTGTCWSFSTTSLIESQALKNNLGEFDLSEWYTVRNIYIEKARNYVLRQGNAQFSEGGLGHDQIRAIAKYGAMPEEAYSGMSQHVSSHDHSTMSKDLKSYLDTLLKKKPIDPNWLSTFTGMMDKMMGTPPETFEYRDKKYTPQTFAKEVLRFNADDYVSITSFTHHPYYKPFVIEVPDNFSNGMYYNLPLNEMLDLVKTSIKNSYSIMWDTDVSNGGFKAKQGVALYLGSEGPGLASAAANSELDWTPQDRQRMFENLSTQDDHLMHIVGIDKSKDGKTFYNVKNSWGNIGPYGGFVKVSEAYLAMNTISLVIPKAALNKALIDKLKL